MTDKQVAYTAYAFGSLVLAYFIIMTAPIIMPFLLICLIALLERATFPELVVAGMAIILITTYLSFIRLSK